MLKKMKNLSLILLALMMVFLVACGPSAKPSNQTSTTPDSKAETSSDALSKDASRPEDEKAERIVSLPVWATEILLDMAGPEKLVGISAFNDPEALSANSDKAAQVAERVESGNPEKIVSLAPDLVILDTFNDFDGSLSKTLTDAGLKVLTMESPLNFDQIKSAITSLGEATGYEKEAMDMKAQIDSILDEVSEKTSALGDQKLKVMFFEDYFDQSGANAGMLAAYGEHSPFDAIAKAAGLINVCTLETYSPVDREIVVGEWRPEILVVPSILYDENFLAHEDDGKTVIKSIEADALLADLPALVNKQIYAIPTKYMSSTSHYMAEAVRLLAKAAYPELFD